MKQAPFKRFVFLDFGGVFFTFPPQLLPELLNWPRVDYLVKNSSKYELLYLTTEGSFQIGITKVYYGRS